MASARTQYGLVTSAELTQAGVTPHARSRMLRAGVLNKVHRTVYRLASHPDSFEQACLAACLAAPEVALSGPTAGRLLGVRKVATTEVHVLGRAPVNLMGVVSHRTNMLTFGDVQQVGPMRVLRPARLACDLADFLSDDDLESVIEQMIDRRMVSLESLRSIARQFVACGRGGSLRIARVLDGRPAWRRPADSDLELRLLRSMQRAGLQVVTQHPIDLDNGRRIMVDLAVPALRLAIEVDHVTWHGGRLEAQRDKVRDRDVMRLGWLVARVTDEDIERRLEPTVQQLVEIAATRAA